MASSKQGPLHGIRVVEFAGIGPGPLCGMLLADLGAEVLLIERGTKGDTGIQMPRRFEVPHRGKASIVLDLKRPANQTIALGLIDLADVLIEGFRPGTMERLGLGPEVCLARNPRLVYGRMTGYGQDGPLALVAGHDLNYISLSGTLHVIGRAGGLPTPPLNLVGDYAGGSMLLAFGITSALIERQRSGNGQIIDASMVEGAALLMSYLFGMRAAGLHDAPRGENLLDSGAPFYDVYECSDGKFIAFAAIEHKFREVFAQRTGFPVEQLMLSDDPVNWPSVRAALKALFKSQSRAHWCEILEDHDACVTPVLSPSEVQLHRHNNMRKSFTDSSGFIQPQTAPRFSRTPSAPPGAPPESGQGGVEMARNWGLSPDLLQTIRI